MKDPAHDPFGEQERAPYRMLVDVLGIRVRVRSNSQRLLRILEQAFGALRAHRFASRAQRAELTLLLRDGPSPSRITRPARMRMHSGARVLLGIMDADNLVSISVEHRSALLCVNRAMLGFSRPTMTGGPRHQRGHDPLFQISNDQLRHDSNDSR